MSKLPRRLAPFIFGTIQAAVTTGIATAIATPWDAGLNVDFFARWSATWAIAWLTVMPVVILFAPLIRRAVEAMTAPSDGTDKSP